MQRQQHQWRNQQRVAVMTAMWRHVARIGMWHQQRAMRVQHVAKCGVAA
jgi:hypothetical protein